MLATRIRPVSDLRNKYPEVESEIEKGPVYLTKNGYGSSVIVSTTFFDETLAKLALYEKIASNILEVKARGASTMVITQDGNGAFKNCADTIIQIPECGGDLESIISVIPAQLFAYYCAVQKGLNPDMPRNLAKSVTVE